MNSLNNIEISVDEFVRLKDIETRFTIMCKEILRMDYVPIHQQILLGIEKEYAAKHINEVNADMFPEK